MVYAIYMDVVIILIAVLIGFALATLALLFSTLRLLTWLGRTMPDAYDIEITDKRKNDSR